MHGGKVLLQVRVWGQTIECVMVDLARLPSGALTGFNAYVALSRGRGRETIRVLWDFDEKLFTVHPNEELRAEDMRLDRLAATTFEHYCGTEFKDFTMVNLLISAVQLDSAGNDNDGNCTRGC